MALIQSVRGNDYLTFDDDKHRYTLNGSPVPGVTTFIHGSYPTSEQLISWKIGQGADFAITETVKRRGVIGADERKELVKASKTAFRKATDVAADIGTCVHDYAYLIEMGFQEDAEAKLLALEQNPSWEKISRAIAKFEDWRKGNRDQILGLEQTVASVDYQFGGKFDRLVKRGPINVLCDYKTSGSIYTDQFVQLGAYALAISEWLGIGVQGLEILRFGKDDGDFETELVDDPAEVADFIKQAINCRQTYDFVRRWSVDKRFKVYGAKKS